MNDVFVFLGHLGTFCVLVNMILYLKRFARNGKAFQFFTMYLVVISIVQLTLTIMRLFLTGIVKNNLYMSNIYLIGQFVFLTLFFMKLLNRKYVGYIGIVVSLFLVIQYIDDPSIFMRYNTIGIAVTQGVLIAYCLLYFYKALSTEVKEYLIINFGVLMYLLSSTLIFASGNFVFDFKVISKQDYFLLLIINSSLFVIFHILIFIEWYRNYRLRKS